LEFFTAIWYIFSHSICNVVEIWYIFPRFGKLWQEKSGNPVAVAPVLHISSTLISALQKWLKEMGISGFDEESGSGGKKHVASTGSQRYPMQSTPVHVSIYCMRQFFFFFFMDRRRSLGVVRPLR
jgi:hypothetical protein